MNFKKYGVSKNVMPSAVAETKELNGITVTCDGKGTYTISGTASEYTYIVFDIPEFTTPISIGQGGNGALSFFNTFDSNKTQIAFYYNSTRVDDWVCTPLNRTNTVYSAIGNKTINKITVNISGGTSVQGTVSPMFTNDGQLPAEFEPHMIWHDTPHYIHNTSTDTLTTLPAVVYPNAATATVGLKGQAVQSSTPSPTSPVMPEGCGDKTANLLNPESKSTNQQGAERWGGVFPAGTYYVLNNTVDNVYYRDGVSSTSSTAIIPNRGAVITTTDELVIWHGSKSEDIMVAESSTALPFEPYGYKIPISSADNTSNVYLGEVETTRKIRKYEITGQENITQYTISTGNLFRIEIPALRIQEQFARTGICTHYRPVILSTDRVNGTISGGDAVAVQGVVDIVDDYATVEDFKAYLAAQYAAGTPVTVWYVLATPTTGIVNEPLMRIGDYADTLSGISIPVTAGGDTISVGTTVQPSEVTVNYKGWHPVQNVHERDNGAWT